MADLNEKDSAQTTKVVGSDSSGVESNFLAINPDGSVTAKVEVDASSGDNILIAGTDDGTVSGTVNYFVNNKRLQILDSHDRQQDITYADFGTKDQRITLITYTSPTFPGIMVNKTISYTLVGNKYRRDSIIWSLS